eukprot:TRINITY_DN47059_c0_g1_i1.p1 TRINITY_DN47059_c0_g1~~TRINITY_DN47059_c0_g1_i1.p1  ORF type:complete len:471 (+),score=146.21 TRINITY_DN47059_c0_g1_i1:82-1413(+)
MTADGRSRRRPRGAGAQHVPQPAEPQVAPRLPELPSGDVELREIPGRGRGLFAVRDLPPDYAVMLDAPAEAAGRVVDPACCTEVCDSCLALAADCCSGCQAVAWCAACAEAGRAAHAGRECAAFAELRRQTRRRPADVPTADLGSGVLLPRILAMYETYNPAKLPEVDSLVERYGEGPLLEALVHKYGPEPDSGEQQQRGAWGAAGEKWDTEGMEMLGRMLLRLWWLVGDDPGHPVWGMAHDRSHVAASHRRFRKAACLAAHAAEPAAPVPRLRHLADGVEMNCFSVVPATHRPSADAPPFAHPGRRRPAAGGGKPDNLPSFGTAVYTLLALTNHSCAPNLTKVCDGWRTRMVTVRPIAAGEELLSSYISCGATAGRRRAELQSAYGFDCDCSRCAGGAEADLAWSLAYLCSCSGNGLLMRDAEDPSSARCCMCGEWQEAAEP